MDTKELTIAVGIIIAAMGAESLALDNPSVGSVTGLPSPVGSPTVPVTSRQSGLFRTPNPIDTSGNLIITGEIGGGKHFRGVVPYRSVRTLWIDTPSLGQTVTSLDSFLRDSYRPTEFYRVPASLTTFYPPSDMVTTIRPGSSEIFRSPLPAFDSYAVNAYSELLPGDNRLFEDTMTAKDTRRSISLQKPWTPPTDIQAQDPLGLAGLPNPLVPPTSMETRPLSMTTQELATVVLQQSDEFRENLWSSEKTIEYGEPLLEQVGDESSQDRESLTDRDNFSQPQKAGDEQAFETKLWMNSTPMQGVPLTKTHKVSSEIPPDNASDVYEQMRQQVQQFQESYKQFTDTQKAGETVDEEKQAFRKKFGLEEKKKTEDSVKTKKKSAADKAMAKLDMSVRAKGILGEYKSFAAYSNDKFNKYLRAAEEFLKKGKYYRAADSYSLASIYRPNDPLVWAGKSHALFAAGEYMSSALFLSRALNIFGDYASFKIDLVAMVGDRDTLESRIANVEELVKLTGSGELQFLLAYVYYQMGRVDMAKVSIEAASKELSDSRAVAALKAAIDKAAK